MGKKGVKKKSSTKKTSNISIKTVDKRLPLLALLIVLVIISFFLNLLPVPIQQELEKIVKPSERQRITDSSLPVLSETSRFPILSAQGAIAIDLDSASILFEKNADFPLLPASTTKIMTALVAMDAYALDDVITVPIITVDGQKMSLVAGEKITFENLLYGLLVFSANDAAEVLAAQYPGGRDAFVAAMNAKTREVGMKNTQFVNPTGLDAIGHRSTARDMVHLAQIAMQNEKFAEVVGTKEMTVRSVDNRFVHRLTNINELLGTVDGVFGIKTGWTEAARENLVTAVRRQDKTILIALLGSQDRFGETRELIEWLYKNYTWQKVLYNH